MFFLVLIDFVCYLFECIYLCENFEFVVLDMVCDCGIGLGFYCVFCFCEGVVGWESLLQDCDLDVFYVDDVGKFVYFYDKFCRRLCNGNWIFVYKFYKDQLLLSLIELCWL